MGTLDTTNAVTIDEDSAIKALLSALEGSTKYSCVTTTGRGGLSIAQRIAYQLGIQVKLVADYELGIISKDNLFVDDIACTGETIGKIPRNVDIAVLVHRVSSEYEPTFSGLLFKGSEYIKFSWEA